MYLTEVPGSGRFHFGPTGVKVYTSSSDTYVPPLLLVVPNKSTVYVSPSTPVTFKVTLFMLLSVGGVSDVQEAKAAACSLLYVFESCTVFVESFTLIEMFSKSLLAKLFKKETTI